MRKRNAQGVFVGPSDDSNTRVEPNKWYGQQPQTTDANKLRRMLKQKGDDAIAELSDAVLNKALENAEKYHARQLKKGAVAVNIYARAQVILRREHEGVAA